METWGWAGNYSSGSPVRFSEVDLWEGAALQAATDNPWECEPRLPALDG